ncbi:hypothetical protein EDB86DRAFT_3083471 [Lactarius hatsudake]|nr:hypothetical protein EDB86DRAFT_3083471 [Lactarius hatsudake]
MPAPAWPPPFSPTCTSFARKGGAREHIVSGPSPSPLAKPPCTRGKGDATPGPPLPIRAEGVPEGTPLCVAPTPSPFPLCATPFTRGAHEVRAHATPLPVATGPSPSPLTALPCTRTHRSQRLPSPLAAPPPFPLPPSAAPPRTHGKGHEGHPATTVPSPSPFDRAALYARDRGARGQATSGPTLPIRVEEARMRDMSPRAPLFDRAALYVWERGTQGQATPGPTLPIRAEGAHMRGMPPRAPLFDHAALYAWERGAQGQATPDPTRPFPFARKGHAQGARCPPSP